MYGWIRKLGETPTLFGRWTYPALALCAGLSVVIFGMLATNGAPRTEQSHPSAEATTAPSISPTATRTVTALPTSTLAKTVITSTATPTRTASPTATSTPTATPTLEPTLTPTATPIPEPQPTPDGIHRVLRVPILMYHYISEPPAPSDSVRVNLSVPPEVFREHLAYLQAKGFETITLRDLVLAMQTGALLPERPIILTFDDGYRDAYTQAFPALRDTGMVGTFFLLTQPIDAGNPAHVTWDQVIEMHAAGMEMQAHGYTHVDLRNRDVDYLVWQMLGSKEAIEERIGEPVRFFCYPSGHYDEMAIRVLRSAHYWAAVTTRQGIDHASDQPFELERIRVQGWYTADDLGAILTSWLEDTTPATTPGPEPTDTATPKPRSIPSQPGYERAEAMVLHQAHRVG